MKFPGEFIEKVREASNILDVIGQHVQLTRAGTSYRGLCPFPAHAEKTPSFFVSDVKQVYHCFGCRKSGNVFSFLMDYQGVSFPDAVIVLAERAHLQLPEVQNSKEAFKKDDETKIFYKLNKYAGSFFHKNLASKSVDHPAKKYIEKRQLSAEVIEEFKIGYAENSWQGLTDILKKGRAPLQGAEKLGLIKKKQDGQYFDMFRDRIMFPIITASGNVIGFGGRSIDDAQQPKYLNSPETPVFNKSRTLYGVHATAKYIRAEQEVILVEGYMDLVSLYQFGVKNVVATLGTAFTIEHAKAIQKLCNRVVVLFDSDGAGQEAADRSLLFFAEVGLLSRQLVLKDAKDPDEFIRKNGVEEFKKQVSSAADHFTVFLNKKMSGYKGRSTEKMEILDAVRTVLDRVKDQQLRSLYLQEVADRLNIDTRQLARATAPLYTQVHRNIEENRSLQKSMVPPKDELLLVQFMLIEKEHLELIRDSHVVESFVSEGAKDLSLKAIERYCQNPNDFDKLAASLLAGEALKAETIQILKDALSVFNLERLKDKEEERKMIGDCILRVRQRSLKQRSKEILNSIKTDSADSEAVTAKLKDFMQLAKEQKVPQRR